MPPNNKRPSVIEDSIARTKPKRTTTLRKEEDKRLRLKSEAEVSLYPAAFDGDLARVLSCLDNGADVNFQNDLSRTPLHGAAETFHVEVVRTLLNSDANVNVQEVDGYTLHLASVYIII
jgi:ankyrin repeat protein